MSGLARRLADLSSNTDLNYGLKIDGNKKKKMSRPAAVHFRTSPATPQTVAFSSGSCLPASSPFMKWGSWAPGSRCCKGLLLGPCVLFSAHKMLKEKKLENVPSLGFWALLYPGRKISPGPKIAWSSSFSKLWGLCKSLLQDITWLRPMAVCNLPETEWKRRWIHSSKQGRSSKFARTVITCGWLRSNWKQLIHFPRQRELEFYCMAAQYQFLIFRRNLWHLRMCCLVTNHLGVLESVDLLNWHILVPNASSEVAHKIFSSLRPYK